MDLKSLHQQMTHYNRWKQQMDNRLTRFESWSKENGLLDASLGETLKRTHQLLGGENFTLACVGEFSRGKTELVNALLYAGGGRRILPSQAGRTTMCPTEIFWDPAQNHSCVRLLPIETRRATASLQSFKRIPQKWVTINFDVSNHEQARAAINQVSASKKVSVADAIKMGFAEMELIERDEQGMVTIPSWRHALICMDHPLLREGLRIVDTPGLNALGNEPELTLKTLPDAQAILFLLSADAGVTASDLDIWRSHIQSLRENNCTSVIPLLNKIDALWDELTPTAEINKIVQGLRELTARQLDVPVEHVLAISAKQGLLGKVGRNQALLEQSNFPKLESTLVECVAHSQQRIVGHRLIGDSYEMIINARNSLLRRISESETEITELMAATPETAREKLQELREAVKRNHHEYHKQALSLKTSQKLLDSQKTPLLSTISSHKLELQIAQTNANLSESWTTMGLAQAIGNFFDDVENNIGHLEREIERCNQVLKSIYERPEYAGNKTKNVERHLLQINQQRRQLRQLSSRAQEFRKSLTNLFIHKSALINRFVETLVQEVRNVYTDLNDHIEHWLKEALAPLLHQNQYQKQLLEHHMLRLTQLQDKRNTQTEQLKSLHDNLTQLKTMLSGIEPLYAELLAAPLGLNTSVTIKAAQEGASSNRAQVVSIEQMRQTQIGKK